MLLVELLEAGDVADRAAIVSVDALHLHIARGPDDEGAPGRTDGGHCPLDLVKVVVRLLELVVAVDILQMLPLLVELDRHFTKRTGLFHFEDADGTCGVRVCELDSIGGGTPHVVSEHSDSYWLQHCRSCSDCIDRHRLVVHSPLDGRDIVKILLGEELVAETLDVRRVGIPHHNDRTSKHRRRDLSISISHPIVIVTLAISSKREIANFIDR